MVENISNIQLVNADTLEFQNYQQSDTDLVSSFSLDDIGFTSSINKIEYHIFDFNQNIITSNYDSKAYNLVDNILVIDPKNDLTSFGFDEGQYYTLYHFLLPLLNSSLDNKYFISEISSDRTELRLTSNTLDSQAIINGYNDFINQYSNTNYFPDFYLNFGDNNLIIANNILLDNSTILIKLYEPLPPQFDLKSELWIVNKIADSIAYYIELITVLDNPENIISLKGPNLNISIKDKINNSTDYTNYTNLQTSVSSSLTNQLNNILLNKSIRLNIDYSDYSNFIHFSSAETRLENFYYKLSLIEEYTQNYISSSFSPTNYYLTGSQNVWLNKIKEIQDRFDGYEYHLYYSSGSTSWPKSNSTQPYVNYPTTASQATTWLTGQLSTASLYDSENKDALVNAIPLYLREDSQNAPYELFIEMLGQHFDNLYLYYTEISNKYNSDNRVDAGPSKDLISDILKDFGIKIYQNNFSTDDLYSSFLGITNNLNLLPSTGSELITNYITASNEIIPLENVNNEIYKRIYHNLPLLFKKKGTIDGLRLLINLYGIPDTILRINEFGGKNKINSNDWDQFQNQFNYSFFTTESGYIKYNLMISKSDGYGLGYYGNAWYGGTSFPTGSFSTEFRFKTTGIPTTSNFSQSIAYFAPDFNYNIVLEYTGSGYTSGSYNGSIPDIENQYGILKFIDNNNNSASVYLPFFNEDWWSVLVTINESSPYTSSLFVKNKIYDGYDGNKIGFQASSSVSGGLFWFPNSQSFYLSYSGSRTIAGKVYTPFSGSFQELRFYNIALDEEAFDDYVMNPYSIEGNQLLGSQSSLNKLIFRAPLGSVLDITGSSRTSIHPSITNFPPTQSFFLSGSSTYNLSGSYSFVPNIEITYLDQFPAGVKNAISNKIKIENTTLPEGNVLSPFESLQQNYAISESYTRDVNYVEVAFSPQNEINDDIISQLGYFNIGEYIGDPRQLVNKNPTFYPDFNQLRDEYFKKYQNNYNLVDYIRLIKYFDNSLFKLIKDFVPARTSLASGVVIKQHLLERNRYSPAQVSWEEKEYTSSIKSFPYNYEEKTLYKTLGETGGVFPNLNGSSSTDFNYPGVVNITQSWTSSFNGPTGISYISHSSQDEFFDGEFKGSIITVSTGSLNGNNPFLNGNDYQELTDYDIIFFNNIYPTNETNVSYDNTLNPYSYANSSHDLFFDYFINSPIQTGSIYLYVDNQVTYIKIASASLLGTNNSDILNKINSLSIKYSNNSSYTYTFNLLNQTDDNFTYLVTNLQNNNYYIPDGIQTDYKITVMGTTMSFNNAFYNPPLSLPYLIGATASYNPNNFWQVNGNPNFYNGSYYKIPTGSNGLLTGSRNNLYNYEIKFDFTNILDLLFGGVNLTLEMLIFNPSTLSMTAHYIKTTQFGGVLTGLQNLIPYGNGGYYGLFTGSFLYNDDLEYVTPSLKISSSPNGYPNSIHNVTFSIYQPDSASNGNSPLIIHPKTSLTKDYTYSDYNTLYGTAYQLEDSQYYDLVEYTDYSVSNDYFNLIFKGLATPAEVKDYYYVLNRHIKPRYIGSRNTSDNFNTISSSTSITLQNDLKISLQPSIKEGVAYNYDTTIFEFNGGKQSIEIPNLSRLDIAQILNVETTSSVTSYTPVDTAYSDIIRNKLPLKSKPQINQYSSDTLIPYDTEIALNDITPIPQYIVTSYPQNWEYAIVQNNNSTNIPNFLQPGAFYKILSYAKGDDFGKVATVYEGTINEIGCIFRVPPYLSYPNLSTLVTWSNQSQLAYMPNNAIFIKGDQNLNYVNIVNLNNILAQPRNMMVNVIEKNNENQYVAGKQIGIYEISQSINNSKKTGERWFMSLYSSEANSLVTPITPSAKLTPLPNNFDPILNPLEGNGVFEISEIEFGAVQPFPSSYDRAVPYTTNTQSLFQNVIQFKFKNPTNNDINGKSIYCVGGTKSQTYIGAGGGGLIIWKSPIKSNTIFTNNKQLNNIGPGNIITNDISPTIKENLNYIVQNFGNKPQN